MLQHFKQIAILPILATILCLPAILSAHPAWGIVVDTQRQVIYFSDLEHVWKIDPEGNVGIFVRDVHSHDLYLDREGVLYGQHHWYEEATDTFHDRYWKVTPSGQIFDISWEEAAPFFERRDADGNAYYVETSREEASTWIKKRTPTGTETILAGGPWGFADGSGTQARLRLPGFSDWGPDGRLYMTNGGMLRALSLDGEVTTIVGPEHGFEHSIQNNGAPRYSALLGLTVTDDGTIYFADIDQRKLFMVTPDGTLSVILDSGLAWLPSGVTVVGDDIYVVEYRTNLSKPAGMILKKGPRVRKIDGAGHVTVVGTVN